MWKSQERIAQGRKYLPEYRQRLINSYAISYSKFAEEFQAVVQKHNTAKSWQDIVDLATERDHPDIIEVGSLELSKVPTHENALSFYLSQIHPWMLEAMLSGQIAMRYHNEEIFEAAISKAHELGGFPSTYVNIPCRVRHSRIDRRTLEPGNTQTSQRSEWAGFGLSPHQMETACRLMLEYINLKPQSANRLAKIKAIDEAYPPSRGVTLHEPKEGRPSSRLYLPTRRSIEMIRKLARRILNQIVEKARSEMTDEEFREPFPWCFSEAGFGIHGEKRTRDHHYHDGTNYLFGLLTAILRVEWPGQFEILGLTVHIVAHPSHANGAEGFASVLNGTYLLEDDREWIGLNPTLAGGLKIKSYSDPRFELHFRKARDQIRAVVDYQHQIEREQRKNKKLLDVRSKFGQLDDLRYKVQNLQDQSAQLTQAKLDLLASKPTPLRSVNESMRMLLQKRKVNKGRVSSSPHEVPQSWFPEDTGRQHENSQEEFSLPSLQREDSRDELMEDASEGCPTPSSIRPSVEYSRSTPPSQVLLPKRPSPFDGTMRPPKIARQDITNL